MTDPCDTRFLLRFKDTIIDAITMIVNQSLATGEFLDVTFGSQMVTWHPYIYGSLLLGV